MIVRREQSDDPLLAVTERWIGLREDIVLLPTFNAWVTLWLHWHWIGLLEAAQRAWRDRAPRCRDDVRIRNTYASDAVFDPHAGRYGDMSTQKCEAEWADAARVRSPEWKRRQR